MSAIAEIESAIEKLSPADQDKLHEWLSARQSAQMPVFEKLRRLTGKGRNLPADLAANHDHYPHGAPRRS
jgi:hypothetical protein